MVYKQNKLRIKKGKDEAARRSGSLVHSMLMATMMMVAEMMNGMEFNCHHEMKLGISWVQFQPNVH